MTGGPFTQEDPIGIAGGLNLYGYAGGDPINFSDPFGLCVENDQECEIVLAQLRSIVSDHDLSDEANGVFEDAIKYYDALQGDVEFVHWPHRTKCCDNSNPETSFWGGGWRGEEGLGGVAYVRLNSALNPWDMALSAVHEAGHGLVPGRGPAEHAEVYRLQAQAYLGLSAGLRYSALRTGLHLRNLGYIR